MGAPDPYAPPRSDRPGRTRPPSPFVDPVVLMQGAWAVFAVLLLAFFFTQRPVLLSAATTARVIGHISFFIWVHSASQAVQGRPGISLSPGWTIGVFFIPIANFLLPYRAMDAIARALDRKREDFPSIWRWWACWLGCLAATLGAVLGNWVATSAIVPLTIAQMATTILMVRDLDVHLAKLERRRRKKGKA